MSTQLFLQTKVNFVLLFLFLLLMVTVFNASVKNSQHLFWRPTEMGYVASADVSVDVSSGNVAGNVLGQFTALRENTMFW